MASQSNLKLYRFRSNRVGSKSSRISNLLRVNKYRKREMSHCFLKTLTKTFLTTCSISRQSSQHMSKAVLNKSIFLNLRWSQKLSSSMKSSNSNYRSKKSSLGIQATNLKNKRLRDADRTTKFKTFSLETQTYLQRCTQCLQMNRHPYSSTRQSWMQVWYSNWQIFRSRTMLKTGWRLQLSF